MLAYLPARFTNQDIGRRLLVSVNTVKSHLQNIYRKLEADDRDAAVARAMELGLLQSAICTCGASTPATTYERTRS